MAKSSTDHSSKFRSATTGRYATVGRTSDGVTVLKSSKPATHFTALEARTTISNRIESHKK